MNDECSPHFTQDTMVVRSTPTSDAMSIGNASSGRRGRPSEAEVGSSSTHGGSVTFKKDTNAVATVIILCGCAPPFLQHTLAMHTVLRTAPYVYHAPRTVPCRTWAGSSPGSRGTSGPVV